MIRKIRETYLGEGEVLCDRCNRIAKPDQVVAVRSPTSTIIYHQHKDSRRCRV